MAERAHPEDPGFQDSGFLGLKKNRYKQRLYERYRFCNRYVRRKNVLDIPCGVGWGTSLLEGATFTIGIDHSEEAIDYAQKHYETVNRRFCVGDMEDICLGDDAVDIIVCLEGFEHVTKDLGLRFIEESKRVLKRGGLLLITCPVLNEKGQTTGNPFHLSEYPEYEFIEILNRSFRALILERILGPDGPEYRAVLSNFKGKRYTA